MKKYFLILLYFTTVILNASSPITKFYEIEKTWWTLPRGEYEELAKEFLQEGKNKKNLFQTGLGNYLLGRYYINYSPKDGRSSWDVYSVGFNYLDKAEKIFKTSENFEWIALVEGVRIKACRQAQYWNEAIVAMHHNDSINTTHNNYYVKGYSLYRKGQLLNTMNQYDRALQAYHKASISFKKGGFIGYSGVCYIHIANIHNSLGNVNNAKEYYTKVQQTINETKALHIANLACYGRFNYYINLKDFDKAREITDSIKILEKELKAIPNFNIRNIHLAKIYEGKLEYQKAIKKLSESLNFFYKKFTKQYPYQHMSSLHFQRGNLEYLNKNFTNAKKDWIQCLTFSELAKKPSLKSKAYEKLSFLMNLEGKFDSAYIYMNKAKVISDSVLNKEKIQQIALHGAYYKNKDLLNEKDILQRNLIISKLKSKTNLIWLFSVGVTLLLCIVIILVFNSKRNLIQKNKLLLAKEQLFRSQMNPHFIFNILNAVQFSILHNKPKEAVISLSKFGKLIRDVLESSREEYISLEKEEQIITNYLEIQKNRLSDQFIFDVIINTTTPKEDLYIPPMLIQPLLENAVEHGVKPLDREGLITVEITEVKNVLHFTVFDNGSGINKNNNLNHNSIALKITEDRLAIFNKVNNNLSLKSNKESGTTVDFWVPVRLIK